MMSMQNNEVLKNFYKVRNGLNIDHMSPLVWNNLCRNTSPVAISLLEKNPSKINWNILSENPAAINLLLKYPEKINWLKLSINPAEEAIKLLEENLDKISWYNLLKNRSLKAIQLYLKYKNLDDNLSIGTIYNLSANPAAIDWIRKNISRIDWAHLSLNPAAIDLLIKHPDKIHWYNLSKNPAPEAIKMIIQNPEKVETLDIGIMQNPAVFQIIDHLSENKRNEILSYVDIFANPDIFIYDYDSMYRSREALHRNLISWMWRPANIEKFLERGGNIEDLDGMLDY